jgi:hypothetical protein
MEEQFMIVIPRRVKRDEARRREAHDLRLAGLTFADIGARMNISRQRVHQLITAPQALRVAVASRADYRCQECGLHLGRSGHVHHKDIHATVYNSSENLVYLCVSCHVKWHAGTLVRKVSTLDTIAP